MFLFLYEKCYMFYFDMEMLYKISESECVSLFLYEKCYMFYFDMKMLTNILYQMI